MSPRVLVAGAAVLKGLIMSTLLYALDVPFWKQLFIVVVSALLTGVFVLRAAVIQARAAERNRREIEHVKRKVGADKRAEDGDG